MNARLRDVLTVSALMAAGGVQAATMAVTITGAAEGQYELDVSGIRKTGRLGPVPGPAAAATVRDLVDIGERKEVKATLRFTGPGGAVATCPEVSVKLDGARAACEPMFVLSDAQNGAERFVCKTTCDRSRLEKSGQDDDDDEWVYALARPFQSFYKRSMAGAAPVRIYSRPQSGL